MIPVRGESVALPAAGVDLRAAQEPGVVRVHWLEVRVHRDRDRADGLAGTGELERERALLPEHGDIDRAAHEAGRRLGAVDLDQVVALTQRLDRELLAIV